MVLEATRPSVSSNGDVRSATTGDDRNTGAVKLFQAGYTRIVSVIPADAKMSPHSRIDPSQRGKVPGKLTGEGWVGFKGWAKHEATLQDAQKWDRWGANVGILADYLPALDIDVDDPKLAKRILKHAEQFLGNGPVRYSTGSRALRPFRAKEPFAHMAATITDPDGNSSLVEFLGQGRQYVVHGKHPSGSHYRWDGGRPLWTRPPPSLPLVDREWVGRFFDTLADFLGPEYTVIRKGDGRTAGDAPPQESLLAPDLDSLREVVALIPNPDHYGWDEYIKMQYAVYAAAGPENETDGFQIWSGWSAKHPRHDPAVDANEWRKPKTDCRVGWTWLQEQAQNHGEYNIAQEEFEADPDAKPPPAAEQTASPTLTPTPTPEQAELAAKAGAVAAIEEDADPQYRAALSAIDALSAVKEQTRFLPALARAHEAISAVESHLHRTHANAVLRWKLEERLGRWGADTLLRAAAMPDESSHGPVFQSLRTLMERPELLEPPEMVLPYLAWRGRAVILAGPDKSGKSTLVAHGIAALTRGEPFLGEPTAAAKVLLITPDEARGDTVRRLVGRKANPDGVEVMMWHSAGMLDDVRRKIAEWKPDLILFDSLQAVALKLGTAPQSGDAAGWSEVVRPIVDLAHELGPAVLVLHHTRKSDGEVRDSSEITAAVDATLTLRKPRAEEDDRLRKIKGRGRWHIEPFAVVLRGEGSDARFEIEKEAREPSVDSLIVRFVANNPGCGKNQVCAGVPARKEAVSAKIDLLVKQGFLENRGTRDRFKLYLTDAGSDPLFDVLHEPAINDNDEEEVQDK